MDESEDEALRALYERAYGCSKGPDCWCATAEEIAKGDEYMKQRAERMARVQGAGDALYSVPQASSDRNHMPERKGTVGDSHT